MLHLPLEEGLQLGEWELIFTYSTYLSKPIEDLNEVAVAVVRSSLAYAAVTSEGSCVWSEGGIVARGTMDIRLRDAHGTAKVRIPAAKDSLAKRALLQAASLRYSEIKLFGRQSSLPIPYVRIVLLPCTLVNVPAEDSDPSKADLRLLHPVVKLYATGDIVVSLRYPGRNEPVSIDKFVGDYLMIPRTSFDSMTIPLRLAQMQARLFETEKSAGSTLGRLQRLRRLRKFDQELKARVINLDFEGRDLTMVPLGLKSA